MSYEKYLETGETWLQHIPAGWKTVRLKNIFSFGKGLPITKADLITDGIPVISYGQIHSKGNSGTRLSSDLFRYVSPEYLSSNPQSLVARNDFIFADTSEDRTGCGNCVFVDREMLLFAGYHSIILKSKEEMDNKYLAYLFLTDAWRSQIRSRVDGVKLFSITKTILNSVNVVLPPCEEQTNIVRYLDWQVSKINRLISDTKKEIELIKEIKANQITKLAWGQNSQNSKKQSGIPGIGEVPEHWAIRANKRIFKERNEKSQSGTETLLSVSRYYGVKPSNELSDDEQYATINPAESLVGYKIVKKNDLAMNIMRAQNGSYGISDYEGIVSPAYCVYELLPGYSPKYMHYLLKTPQMISIFFAASSGITDHRRRLYADDFLRIKIAVPPLEEQKQIVEQIERIEATFQGKTAAMEKQIELLKELRTRLISDVVTGQIDVRDIEIPEYEFVEDVSEDSEDSESEEEIVEQEDE